MAALSQEEYLKRYMSKNQLSKEDRKKKKKKVHSAKDSKLIIIDDDIDIKNRKSGEAAFDEEFNEEAPTVAEFIDERPKHIQQLEAYRKDSRWKVLGDEEDETSTLDYGVISQRHAELQGSERGKLPSRKRHDSSNSDSSLDRSKPNTGKYSSSVTTDRKSQRHDSDSDDSPAKKDRFSGAHRSMDSYSHNSPSRKNVHRSQDNHDSDSDASPPRKLQARGQNEKLPSPKTQRLSKAQAEKGSDDSDNSLPRRHARRHDSDQSPPRKSKQGSSDSDQSLPRKLAAVPDADQSPPRRLRHESSGSDQSPPRRKQTKLDSSKGDRDSQDRRVVSNAQHSRKSNHQYGEQKKATKTLGGAKAGLSSAKEMRDEAKKLRDKEDRSFQNIGDDKLGRNAKTVLRDKETGKRRNVEAEEAKNEEETKKKNEQIQKYKQWGKGLKQQALKDSRLEDQVHEASKPLARFRDDKDLDQMMRQEERMEDPMLAFIRKKKAKENLKSGKKAQKELPRYKGPAPPPNRFNIVPGYRWDGVDRSSGFEKKLFASLANKKAIQEIAYKWSTEDM